MKDLAHINILIDFLTIVFFCGQCFEHQLLGGSEGLMRAWADNGGVFSVSVFWTESDGVTTETGWCNVALIHSRRRLIV